MNASILGLVAILSQVQDVKTNDMEAKMCISTQ